MRRVFSPPCVQVPAPEGGQPPVLKYFSLLMESGKLNKAESLELARPALQQGRVQLVEKWLTEDKVTCSEGLGDMVMPINQKLAMNIYLKAGDAHEKVVQCLLATGDFGRIVPYCAKFGYKPNFVFILQNLVHSNPKAAQEFGTQLVKVGGEGEVACALLFTRVRSPPLPPSAGGRRPPHRHGHRRRHLHAVPAPAGGACHCLSWGCGCGTPPSLSAPPAVHCLPARGARG